MVGWMFRFRSRDLLTQLSDFGTDRRPELLTKALSCQNRVVLPLANLQTRREYDKEIGKGKSKTNVTMYVTEVHATRLQRMDPKPKDATEHEAGEPEGEAVP